MHKAVIKKAPRGGVRDNIDSYLSVNSHLCPVGTFCELGIIIVVVSGVAIVLA